MKKINLKIDHLSKSILILFAALFLISTAQAQHCTCSTSGLTTWGTNSSSTTYLSTHYPTGIISGTCIKVWGTLYIDVNANWTSVDLFMQPGATIIVNSSKSLLLDASRLSGCSAMWSGVTLSSGSSIGLFSASVIRDAVDAINASSVTTSVNIDHSTLTNNNNCIVMTGTMSVTLDYATLQEGTGGLFSGNADKGIDLDNLSSGTLTVTNSTFDLISEPINCNNGSGVIDIQTSTFNGDGATGLGIVISDVTGNHLIAYNPSIDNAQIGIDLSFVTATVEGNTITNMINAGITFSSPLYATSFIQDNILSDIDGLGIQVTEMISTVAVYVRRNDISSYDGFAIQCANSTLGNVSCYVLNNSIYSNQIGAGSTFADSGIHLRNLRAATVNENVVTSQGANSRGIVLDNSQNCSLSLNTANGTSTANGEGFSVTLAPGNSYTCNFTNNSLIGFKSTLVCGSSTLHTNAFNNHDIGLQIGDSSYIGTQVHEWNRWPGTYGTMGAQNLNAGALLVGFSQFTVGTALSTIYHPSNSGNGFFYYDPRNTPTEDLCYVEEDPGHGRQSLVQMLDGLPGSGPQAKASNWDAKRYVYGELLEHPEYLLENEVLAEFFENQAGSDIEKFHLANNALLEGNFVEANAILQGTSPSDLFDQNLKDAYELAVLGNITYNEAQVTLVSDLANQCPATGGSAVFVARSLYNRHVDNNQQFSDDCATIDDRNVSKNISTSTISIAPNPATDFTRVSILEPQGQKKINVVDALGKIIEQMNVAPLVRQVEISLSKYQSGIYYVELIGKNAGPEVHKLVVIK